MNDDLNKVPSQQPAKKAEQYFFRASAADFKKIPGSPIAYWVSENVRNIFENSKAIDSLASVCIGMKTGDNDLFVKSWFELSHNKIGFCLRDMETANGSDYSWYPYLKGGNYRKWYGNYELVLNWVNSGDNINKHVNRHGVSDARIRPSNFSFYFREGINWSFITSGSFGVRVHSCGFFFDVAGSSLFPQLVEDTYLFAGYLNSKVVSDILSAINPTLNMQIENIKIIPFIYLNEKITFQVKIVVEKLINISKLEWDSFETSWDFQSFPWLTSPLKADKTEQSFNNWETHCASQIKKMQELETENNRLFIEAYGLQEELTPEVPEDQITLARADREEDVKRLISYAVGCMMGRYNLDEPGLIYAQSGNEGFNQSKYKTFPADDDGIVPIMDMEWFDDDAAVRFESFVKVAWSPETHEENLRFISESLSAKKGEAPRDTIRRYFSSSFFKDHLKTYKKRPIYWLFSSGKLKAFECLVYLHRYNESTLSRMRNEYVTPLQGKFTARADYLQNEIDSAASASERNKLQKQLDMLSKKQAELRSFDDELRHYADQRIKLDLDDGVKVNYGKFGNLLADVNAITGKKKK